VRVLQVLGGMSWRYGGTTAAVLPMCDALCQIPGVEVSIASTDADGPGRRLTPDTAPHTLAQVHLFSLDWSNRWKYSAGLDRWLQRQAHKYDVIHSHGAWGFCNWAAARAAKRHGVPLVVNPHGMWSNYTFTQGRRLKAAYWSLIERPLARRADKLVFTSQGEAKEFARHGLRTASAVVPLGLPPDAWERPQCSDWLRLQLGGRDRGRPLVLYLSRIHPKKGLVDILLPAFAKLKTDAFLVIAGGSDDTTPGYTLQVRAEIDRLGLADRVQLLGPIRSEDRWIAFDGADVFVLPSHQENFGLVITESMARGCPVVVSDRAFACEVVAAADAGCIVPLDPSATSEAIDHLLQNPAFRLMLGNRGRAYTRTHLRWSDIAQQLFDIYASLSTAPRK